jgi:SAM-dependent methyltransferase
MASDHTSVSPSRIPFQLRKVFDPIIRNYFYYIGGDKFIFENIDDDVLVLDVGTGAGMVPILFRQTSHEVVAIDLSKLAVRTAKGSSGSDSSFIVADASLLPFKKDSFDTVIAVGLFNRIEDLTPFLDEFSRIIKENGKIIFNCNNKNTFIPHKKQQFQANHTKDEINDYLSESKLTMKKYDVNFFMSLNQKKLIQSDRIPFLIKWGGLWISIILNLIAKQIPKLKSKGAHIWVCAEPGNN